MITQAAYTVMFYILAIVSLLMAIHVVKSRRLLRAALSLMAVLVASAGFYIMLGYEFLAGVQVLVYVGGIVVLIVFAIMLTSRVDLLETTPPLHRKYLGLFASLAFFAMTTTALLFSEFPLLKAGKVPTNDVAAFGRKLLSYGADGYVLPFEIISLLLLSALIGGIVISRKTPPPKQPFTSGGDEAGEVLTILPKRQLKDEELSSMEGDKS